MVPQNTTIKTNRAVTIKPNSTFLHEDIYILLPNSTADMLTDN